MDIAGRVALVTGAGGGIGRAMALRLAGEGARVMAADIDAAATEATAGAVREGGGEAVAVGADVTRDEDLQAMFEATVRAFGGLDILCNNAGIATGLPAWPDAPAERWERTLRVDLWAVIRGTQLAIPLMQRRGGGVIVNTASMAGLNGLPQDPVYAAAKGGVVLFTRSLASLKREANIVVCCLCPGVVDTRIVREAEDPRLRALLERFPVLPPAAVAEAVVTLIRDDEAAGRALRVAAWLETPDYV
jgi:NAD(P)-dependent dehydrogenase (short-subunit alcohol dehydrogenase family)